MKMRMLPREHVAEMGDLARVGAGDRLDVLRPLPAGLEGAFGDRMAGKLNHLRLAVALEWAGLVGRVEALDLNCHGDSFRRGLTRRYTRDGPETNPLRGGCPQAAYLTVSVPSMPASRWPGTVQKKV